MAQQYNYLYRILSLVAAKYLQNQYRETIEDSSKSLANLNM